MRDVLGRVQQCCLGGAADVVYSGVCCRRRGCGDVSLGGRVWESGFCVTVWAWLVSAGGGMVLDVLWCVRGGVASLSGVFMCASVRMHRSNCNSIISISCMYRI